MAGIKLCQTDPGIKDSASVFIPIRARDKSHCVLEPLPIKHESVVA